MNHQSQVRKLGNFPKDGVILVSGWHEQRGHSVWNEEAVHDQFYAVENFWGRGSSFIPITL
jgi:hypothetical protein